MTKEEAMQIADLQVEVDGLTEDWFYLLMTTKGRVSKEMGKKAIQRISVHPNEVSAEALMKAEKMEENLAKYGVPCAQWM